MRNVCPVNKHIIALPASSLTKELAGDRGSCEGKTPDIPGLATLWFARDYALCAYLAVRFDIIPFLKLNDTNQARREVYTLVHEQREKQ
jgi:hypothetical protein